MPEFVTTPKKPGAQAVQADALRLPAARAVVVMPAGHALQPAALTVPKFVTAP